jgi:hypothetical protein
MTARASTEIGKQASRQAADRMIGQEALDGCWYAVQDVIPKGNNHPMEEYPHTCTRNGLRGKE